MTIRTKEEGTVGERNASEMVHIFIIYVHIGRMLVVQPNNTQVVANICHKDYGINDDSDKYD